MVVSSGLHLRGTWADCESVTFSPEQNDVRKVKKTAPVCGYLRPSKEVFWVRNWPLQQEAKRCLRLHKEK